MTLFIEYLMTEILTKITQNGNIGYFQNESINVYLNNKNMHFLYQDLLL